LGATLEGERSLDKGNRKTQGESEVLPSVKNAVPSRKSASNGVQISLVSLKPFRSNGKELNESSQGGKTGKEGAHQSKAVYRVCEGHSRDGEKRGRGLSKNQYGSIGGGLINTKHFPSNWRKGGAVGARVKIFRRKKKREEPICNQNEK